MRLVTTCGLLLSLSAAVPAISQQAAFSSNITTTAATTAPSTATPADPNTASVDYTALREELTRQNKILTDQLNTQRAIVKKNQDLLREAQKLDAANKRIVEEQKKLEAQNADLNKQRQALKDAQKPIPETTSTSSSSVASN